MVSGELVASVIRPVDLPPLKEFALTEPVDIRRLDPEIPSDFAIAKAWDIESLGPEGALDPDTEEKTVKPMSPKKLINWMREKPTALLRGIFESDLHEGVKDVGFINISSTRKDHARLRFLQKQGVVSAGVSFREINWWTDRATDEQTESGLTQALLEQFENHRIESEQSGKPYKPLVISLYVEPDDLSTDGRLARKLGFKAAMKDMSYDHPGTEGTDTAFVLTEQNFKAALERREKRSNADTGLDSLNRLERRARGDKTA